MRNRFASTIEDLAVSNERVCLLSGDIGNRMFDRFKEKAPGRFINCGIAEANMMSMAAGMALSGMKPVVYTIAPFTTLRCLEQIRTGVAYHEAPVVIVGTGSGLSYAELGATHHSLEDIAILRSIPNMQICAPADSEELEAYLREAIESGKPTYIRIGKKGEPTIQGISKSPKIGRARSVHSGGKILLLAIGPIIEEAIKAREVLGGTKSGIEIVSMGSVKPLDTEFLEKMAERNYRQWVTLEEHSKIGGLGSAVIEWLSENKISIDIEKIGTEDKFIHKLGTQNYTRRQQGMDSDNIIKLIEGYQ